MSIIGNLLVISVLLRFKQTRSSVNLFIGNMAAADLLSTIFLSWTGLTESLVQNYPNGQFYCQFGDYFKYTCLLASTFSLLVLSADRLKKIISPFRRTLTTKGAVFWCICIWIVAFGISVPHAVWRQVKKRKWLDYEEVWCAENINNEKGVAYWIALLALTCYIPVILMLVFYSAVLCKMKKFRQKLNESRKPVKGVYRRRIIQMIFVYLLVSLVCWAPMTLTVFHRALRGSHVKKKEEKNDVLITYLVQCIMNTFAGNQTDGKDYKDDEKQPSWFTGVKFTQHVFACINAAINPLIYGVVNETFRKAILLQFPWIARCLRKCGRTSPNSRYTRNTIKAHNFPATSHGDDSRSRTPSLYSLKIVTPSLRVINRQESHISIINTSYSFDRSESQEPQIESERL